jgi:hypothetical protein
VITVRTRLAPACAVLVALVAAGALSGCVSIKVPVKLPTAAESVQPRSGETTAAARAREAAAVEKGAADAARTRAATITGRAFFTTKARKVRVVGEGGSRYALVEVWAPGVQEAQFVVRQQGGAWRVLGYAVKLSAKQPAYGVPPGVWSRFFD